MIMGTDMINSILHIDCGLTDLLQPIDQLGRTEGQAEKNAAENHAQSSPARVATFGPFCVHTAERVLERDGRRLKIGGRAFDILLTLVERSPQVVAKRHLIAQVWGNYPVEDGALRFSIAALRTTLGEDESSTARYIVNVRGRGYCLAAPVVWTTAAASPPNASVTLSALPRKPSAMIGRDGELHEITRHIHEHRFVSIIGAGGIGKTTVAIEVAHRLLAEFSQAVCFIDFGGVEDARLVAATLASELGVPVVSEQPGAAILNALREQRMLIVLDSCEHVVEAAAVLAERIFRDAPHVHILTTGREALRAEGEHVHHLPALTCPPPDLESITARQALSFSAVQLFVKEVASNVQSFELGDDDAPAVAEVCRRLDGIPLALELAACRVGMYGIQGTASLLDRQFRLWRGRRTSLPRHQTLSATLDWSYHLLSETERLMLRRLAVFVGGFTLEAALEIVAEGLDPAEVTETLATLVDKSLVAFDDAAAMRYRLLDTTRDYAWRKLEDSGESMKIEQCYCEQLTRRLEAYKSSVVMESSRESIDFAASNVRALRSALEWSFSARGSTAFGAKLVGAAAPLLIQLSLLTECATWTERAIRSLGEANKGTRLELEIQTCFALSLIATKGNVQATYDALIRALDLADHQEDPPMQLLLVHGLYQWRLRSGDFRGLMELNLRIQSAAQRITDPAADAIAKALAAITCFFIGDNRESPALSQISLAAPVYGSSLNLNSGTTPGVLSTLARSLWRRGFPDQAVAMSERAINEVTERNHPTSLCHILMSSIVIPLRVGNLNRAEALIQQLLTCAAKHRLLTYERAGVGWQGHLAILRNDLTRGIDLLRNALACMHEDGYELYRPSMTAALAEGLAKAGRLELAYSTICEAVSWCEIRDRSLELLDLRRLKGDMLASISPDTHAAAELLMSSLRLSNQRGLLSLELRSAISFAKLWRTQGAARQGYELLSQIYSRFSEGFQTRDLLAAAGLLEELRS
jgi:predicted ATPase/DNA-binding winged helix-turn-helix (wHTH) protein